MVGLTEWELSDVVEVELVDPQPDNEGNACVSSHVADEAVKLYKESDMNIKTINCMMGLG
jgi:hypothetical protein